MSSDNQPKVSVGIPVFNQEQHMHESLENLLNQDYPNLEFIICDNGSTDRSAEIYRPFVDRDPRFRLYRYPQNDGPARNFIRAFEFAQSPYYMWKASDDRLDPTYIRKCVEVLEADPDVALAYSYANFVDDRGTILMPKQDFFDLTADTAAERYLNLVGKLGFCDAFYGVHRMSILTQVNIDPGPYLGFDHLVIVQIVLRGKCVQIPERLFFRNVQKQIWEPREKMIKRFQMIEEMLYPVGMGITLPLTDLFIRELNVILYAPIPIQDKPRLVQAAFERLAHGPAFTAKQIEIDRAIALISQNRIYEEWNPGRFTVEPTEEWNLYARPVYVSKLLKQLEDVLLLYPRYQGIQSVRAICLSYLGRVREAKAALETEFENHPDSPNPKYLYQKLLPLWEKILAAKKSTDTTTPSKEEEDTKTPQ
jgi:glycosyltransferase involved in cell wall biosynthesis